MTRFLSIVALLAGCLAVPALAQEDAPRTGASRAATAATIGDTWVVPPVLASGTPLPEPAGYTVRWRSDRAGLSGRVFRNDGAQPVSVRLTGTVTLPGGRTFSKTFATRVLGADRRWLFSYARTPTGIDDANQPTIARSLHLALAGDDGQPMPLAGNYGVAFARGDYVGVDRVELRGVADPAPFYFADGMLGFVATRVSMDGKPDASPSSLVVFKADPAQPAEFIELGSLDLGAVGPAIAPQAVWDGAARRYVLWWSDANGERFTATIRDLARTERVPNRFVPGDGKRSRIVTAGNLGTVRSGSPATVDIRRGANAVANGQTVSAIPVTNALAQQLSRRYDRVRNTRIRVPALRIAPGDVATIPSTRAQLIYSDGSTATRIVDWNAKDLRDLATAKSGTHHVRGIVRQRAYPTILAHNRADPNLYRYERDGRTRYLFVATDDTGNNNVGSTHLPIRIADTINGLSDERGGRAREVDLLNRRTRRDRTAEGRVIAGCYWAPELHEIGGRLSILFAPCFNPADNQSAEDGEWFTVEAHLMQLRDGGDPGNPNDWSRPAAIRQADGTPLGRPGFPGNISLDMSFFEVGGQAYYIWSQRYLPGKGTLGDPQTWIAKVDPAAPTRIASPPRPIIAPDTSFEENLAEGAFAVMRDGEVHLAYSGSGVSPTYVVGGVRASQTADLSRLENWRKWTTPLQHSKPMPPGSKDYLTHEQGPGHGAFTRDEDGNLLYVYHSWGNGVGGDGRDARVRRVHWASGNRPVLDMTAEEEVAPANRDVTMIVDVG